MMFDLIPYAFYYRTVVPPLAAIRVSQSCTTVPSLAAPPRYILYLFTYDVDENDFLYDRLSERYFPRFGDH